MMMKPMERATLAQKKSRVASYLFAKAAIDALGHVNVILGCAARAVGALLGLDRDGLSGANGLAQLARNAALLARWVPAQGVLAAKARRQRALLERIIDCHLSATTSTGSAHLSKRNEIVVIKMHEPRARENQRRRAIEDEVRRRWRRQIRTCGRKNCSSVLPKP